MAERGGEKRRSKGADTLIEKTRGKDRPRNKDTRRGKDEPRTRERTAETERPAANAEIICGRNAVTEALKSGRAVNKVWLADNNDPAFSGAVFRLCQQGGVPCHKLPRVKLDKLAGPDHRGVAAELAALEYVEVADILAAAAEKGEPPFVIVLDQIEDPHNLGAIIRTALCAGAHGVVLPRRRAAALNQTVLKTSAGAANYLPVARVANLNQALDQLKQAGCWAVAADMDGSPMWECDLTGPMALVLGGEGAGLSPLLKKNCDLVAAIPMQGSLGSLNVSNAGAVLMYEILRQRARPAGPEITE